MDTFLLPFKSLSKRMRFSERFLSQEVGLSRSSLRKVLKGDLSLTMSSIYMVARHFKLKVSVLVYPEGHYPESTALSVGFRVSRDGFESWKIHLMDMVDEFRKTVDVRLFFLPPDKACDPKVLALLAATVIELCIEEGISSPDWAVKTKALKNPWFVSGMESLKASALLESPYSFRSKNIFVHDNFLLRA